MKLILSNRKFTDAFGRSDGALDGWDYTNSAWAISGNAAVCTPTLGTEKIVNGSFSADSNWNKGAGWSIGSGVASHANVSPSNLVATVAPYTIGVWYKATWDLVSTDGDQLYSIMGLSNRYGTVAGAQVDVNRASATTAGFRAQQATLDASIDNASSKPITLSDMMATRNFTRNATLNVKGTLPVATNNGIPFGVVGWLDSYTTPANFIIAYFATMATGSFRVDKCVGGTYTNLIAATPTYAAGAYVKLRGTINGGNLSLTSSYNGAYMGSATVTDAGIVSNVRHGMFSGDAANRLESFSYSFR